MIIKQPFIIATLLIAGLESVWAQAPVISYSSPQVYTINTAISPLSPTSTGGTVPLKTVVFGSGFNNPNGLAIDATGNIYFAENGTNDVKKIPGGPGTPVIIGSGFLNPTGVAVDASGDVYVADCNNNEVKEVPVNGGSIIVLGSGFNHPYGIALDASDNVYVSDFSNNAIKEIPAGNGTPVVLATGFNGPTGVTIDASGNIYVADQLNNVIKKVASGTHAVTTLATGYGNPDGVAVDVSGNVYFSDKGDASIAMLPVGGGGVVQIGSGFVNVLGVAVDENENVYVSDDGNGTINGVFKNAGFTVNPALPSGLAISPNTGVISGTPTVATSAANYTVTALNGSGSGTASINIAVSGIAKPIISYASPQVYTVGTAISPLSPTNTGGALPPPTPVNLAGTFNNLTGIAIDPAGNVYVAENGASDVKEIPVGGGTPFTLGSGFDGPTGVAVDGAGNVYVADFYSNGIKKIPAGNGPVVSILGGLSGPYGVAVDKAGDLYFSEFNGGDVKKIPSGGGTPVVVGSGFSNPTGLAVDASGNVYVTDRGHNAIKKILASNGSTATLSGGIGNPNGVAVDAVGNVYFADTNLSSITEIPVGGGGNIAIGSGFLTPTCVAVDPNGDIFIGDNGNSVVTEIGNGGYKINPALPVGLSFNANTGVISGTPTAVSAAKNYTVTATNGGGSGTAVINITVNLPAKPVITYSTPQTYIATEAIAPLAPVSSGGPISSTGGFAISPALPSGFNFDVNTGIISGTPAVAHAATNYTVTATNAGGKGSTVVIIAVKLPPKPIISYSTPNMYTTTVTIAPLSPSSTGGPIPSSGAFSISPTLPAGLSFDMNTGIISGTPTSASPATAYKVTATNITGGGTTTISIRVNPYPAPVVKYSTPQSYPVDFAITPLSPTASNVGTAGSGAITTLGSGFVNFTGVAVDAAGDVYVAEDGNNAVREILAGGGSPTTLGSGFSHPTGVAVDASGNVYVVDNSNNAVKEIPAGNGPVVTIATGFNGPYGIAIDAAGNLYVGDASNNQVKKIPAGSNTPVVIGTGFNHPTGVAVDAAGNVYVADRANNLIKEILASNGSTIVLGSGYGNPNGVAVGPGGNIYFADTNNSQIAEIPAGGGANIQVGSGFSNTIAVAVSVADPNIIYVGSNGNGQVEKVAPTGGYYISPALPEGLTFSPATGTISGTPSVISPATSYTVKAYNIAESGSATVSIAVYNTNSGLAKLAVSSGTLSPTFATAVTNYSVNVSNGTSTITLTPTTSLASNTVTVNGTAVASGSASMPVSLSVGANPIAVVVKSSAGKPIGAYAVTAYRAPSSNDALAGMSVSAGTLNPAFSNSVLNYQVAVSDAVTDFSITPVTADSTATIKVDNQAVASGTVSSPVPLSEGINTVSVVVTAQDGTTTQTYVITVDRSNNDNLAALKMSNGTLTPAFASSTTSYTANVANIVASMTVTPTSSDPAAAITINGASVTSGTTSAAIPLVVGPNTITIIVTAAGGLATKTYTLTITRTGSSNANLSTLGQSAGGLTPAFSSSTTSYTDKVNNATATMTLKPVSGDANATITVNGTPVTSGTVTAPIALTEGGQTTISTVVTAQDGVTTKTYAITVTRAPSGIATLSNLQPSSGTLSPVFASSTVSYTTSVANAISTIAITPITTDTSATVTVNGTAVSPGTASGAITLTEGAQTAITTVVTSQDGTATKTYTLLVTRVPSSDATLSNLQLSSGTLSPAFASATASYTASVANTVSSITLTPTTTDANATIKVNGTAVTSGMASGSIALAEGTQTIITTVVTAQDGTTTQTDTVTVTRAPSANANLATLGQSLGGLTPAFSATTTSYTINASNAAASMTLKPTSSDANATIKVNGTTVASGTITAPIALAVGANTITTVVTAQNGTTAKTYTLTVTRAAGGADSYIPIAIGTGIGVTKPTETATLAEDGIQVHQGVSPNGDGINDFLQIDNISQYPDNELMIMNRNGQLIYEAKGYDNSSKVFDGHSNKNGQMQLPGTYFYALDYTVNGVTKHKTGFIVLKY